ncbi:MAG: nucleotidyltransferase family protein [Candidatus Eisenbacteria bacterium]|uniref:Nucleotidyltransferase family protein n=1 Tax=Eiseniibacteriota bacterium TaxID=2212470 RepID=A0A956NH11_UNCEI|nr:nucleotidyltransferase family protein [Candidatus Eisenbacteria bacterium]MCB9466432.1 nucleotidyltransferase family protein [Candidatus Eisenbacteria bacterium]
MTTIEVIQAKRDDVLQVARKHGVTSIRIFGSVARGDDSPESDIDLLITTGPVVSSWFPAGLILDLEALLGRDVEIVTEPGLNPLLREQVLSEAVNL